MKKARKRAAPSRRIGTAANAGSIPPAPPENVIKEMLALFQAGRMDLFEQHAQKTVQRWPDHPFGWKALGNLHLMRGRYEEALEPFRKCLRLAPSDPQVHNNLGSILLELGRLEEAEASYRRAVALKPDYAQAHNNLGIILMKRGRPEEAATAYRTALESDPNFAEAHNNLGNCLKEIGRTDEAEASYRQAIRLKRDFVEAHCNLGNVLLELGRPGEAEERFRKSLTLKPDYVQAHSGLGDSLLKRGRLSEALSSFRQCLDLDPLWVRAHDGLSKALGNLVPAWHVPMMNDRFRNDAYCAALQNAVTADTHVLEIGTGSGLLAMMAARLGANRVTTCEAVAEIAETARAIVADNGLAPPVTVINKMSTKLVVGEDMDERADLLVSEILSSEFLGEGVLASIEDAKRRLLKPGARIIPARGSIQFALFGGPDIEKNIRVDEVCGFNLGGFNGIVARKQYVGRNDLDIELLSGDIAGLNFDFVNTDRFPQSEKKSIEVPVNKSGRCCGIIQWIRLELDDAVTFENHPAVKNPASSWQHCLYVLPAAIDVKPGQTALVTAAHNRNTPWFFLENVL